MARSRALSFCAAWNAAPPSMIAMRLPIGIDLEHFADNGADQGLVSLSGRERMDGGGDGAADIDVDAAGIGVGGGFVLRIEQRLEGRIGAAGLEAGRHADAGEEALRAQAVALRD